MVSRNVGYIHSILAQWRTDKLIHLKHFGSRKQKINLNLSVNNLQILAVLFLHLSKKPCSFEGYDLNDPAYVAWLKINHLEVALSITGSDELSLSSEKSIPSSSSPTASVGVNSSDVLSEALTLPPPKPSKTKRKTAVNSKAVCITDEVL